MGEPDDRDQLVEDVVRLNGDLRMARERIAKLEAGAASDVRELLAERDALKTWKESVLAGETMQNANIQVARLAQVVRTVAREVQRCRRIGHGGRPVFKGKYDICADCLVRGFAGIKIADEILHGKEALIS